jgi:hypothetical protein
MKRLQIDVFRTEETEYKPLVSIISEHFDATTRVTYLLDVKQVTHKDQPKHCTKGSQCYCIPAVIDHWLISDGTITIFYKSGFRMEIRRIND